ncbi:uncharacterized protein LOC129895015 [Solanum dulcamara]|uniref:uncharacterized protein LOC129895015 n=1 Tax=Solanum dulcamara TaxID=45834 RepID=UPI0024867643|nr:uncharacterized protein LOC129895015 [Solanum dulcamara]
MQARRESSQSPSFNSYSNKNLAAIADRVVQEFRAENGTEEEFVVDDNGGFSCFESGGRLNDKEEEQGNEDDDEFEFSFVKESEISPVAADEIFYNGQIRPIYPLFNRDLLLDFMNDSSNSNSTSEEVSARPKSIRLPLRKLFLEEEREANSSCSSSEIDDLEGIAEDTYCVWMPKPEEKSAGGCKKSSSTGSSKRWKFRDLLYRSNSDGKDTFVFLTHSFKKKEENKAEKTTTKIDNASKVTLKSKGVPMAEGNPAMHYVKNGGGEKRKTYLPYRQDLVGFLANMKGTSRNVQPL